MSGVVIKNRRNHVYRNRRRERKSPLYTADRGIRDPAVKARKVLEGTRIGDSIAVNGVCLTVTSIQPDGFTADVMAETIRRSSLGSCKAGSQVNLERAMAADGRFGGHIVSGHIDGTGVIRSMLREENAIWVSIETSPQILASDRGKRIRLY